MRKQDFAVVFQIFVSIVLIIKTCSALQEIPGVDPEIESRKLKNVPVPHSTPKIQEPVEDKDFFVMKAGNDRHILESNKKELKIFCRHAEPKLLTTIFKTVEFHLQIATDNFCHYEGPNATAVRQEYKESSWFSFYPWRFRTFKLNIYKQSCLGIETNSPYSVSLRVRWVDFWRVVTLVLAVLLFFAARHLAKNIFFHYTTGIAIGIFGSLLILVYVVARFVPKKSGAVTLMVGGWGLAVYLIQYLWQNLVQIVKENHAIAVGYVVMSGLISFAVVYRYGPLTDERSINLVQWAMQLVSLVAIFLSSQYREATLGIVIVMVTYQSVPDRWKAKFQTIWRRRFPPKVKRLTEEEYLQQANVETRKALDELREFCRSPKCDAWKTVSRLKTPQRYVEFVEKPRKRASQTPNKSHRKRFAEFVEGGSHLDDDMILAYESNHVTPTRVEDDDDEEELLTSDDEEDM